MTSVDRLSPPQAILGEGPWWDHRDQRLFWVDIRSNSLNSFDPKSDISISTDVGEPIACVFKCESERFIIGTGSGVYSFEPRNQEKKLLGKPSVMETLCRFNDGCTDALGRLWLGTMIDGAKVPQRRGHFYRLDRNGSLDRFFGAFYTTNGLAFSPDGNIMYYADTNKNIQTIWSCDYDLESGLPSNSKVFFDCREIRGRPDGATVDIDGCYWFASVGGWSVVRITPYGKVDRIVEMPVEKPSKVMFGGPRLDILYVTTISEGVQDLRSQPGAGCLFAITGTGTSGLEQRRYRGG